MADPNISKHTIEDVQAAITRRLSPYPPDDGKVTLLQAGKP